jgi:crotonobetainyl-CoA:carnitine CoA-transferase CaiB-like acyl-CoA transferase
VIENFRPGVMARYGLDEPTLRAERPGLVYCRIAGLGKGDVAGYDFLAQAVGGLMSITGDDESGPLKVGVALVDVMAGLHATIGILSALRHRDRTGEGQLVEVDLLSTTLFALANQASGYLTAGIVPGRLGNRHPSIAPYETLRAADGPLVVAIGNDGQFRTLCERLEVPALAEDERFATNASRVANRDALAGALESRLRSAPAATWFAYAREVGLDPVVDLTRPDGSTVPTMANPIGLSATPASYRLAPPRLGEHTDQVRREVGG